MHMPRYLIAIALIVASAIPAANAAGRKESVDEALKREQRIQALSTAPRSVHNICRGC
jgi:hypothetical protein